MVIESITHVEKYILSLRWKAPIALFLISFSIYLHNLSPSVFGGDSGDIITAAYTHGIAHPSGYPLITLISWVFSLLPGDFSIAWKMGVLSSLLGALSVVGMYFLVLQLVRNRVVGIITALTLAFLYPFWLYAEVVEVFMLHYFFVIMLLLTCVLYLRTKREGFLWLLCFLFGLSLTNNESIAVLLPVLGILLFRKINPWRYGRTTVICLVLFFIGLLPYLYIPLAASSHPLINWDSVQNLPSFLSLILRSDYGWYTNESAITLLYARGILQLYGDYWIVNFGFLLLLFMGIGIIYLARTKQYRMLSALLAGILLSGPILLLYWRVPVADNFDVGMLERFFTVSGIFGLILYGYGLSAFTKEVPQFITKYSYTKEKQHAYTLLLFGVLLLIPLSFMIKNFQKTNFHDVLLGDTFAEDIITPLPAHSTLVLEDDTEGFNVNYLQIVRGMRKDLILPGADRAQRVAMSDEYKLSTHPVVLTAAAQPVTPPVSMRRDTFITVSEIKTHHIAFYQSRNSYKVITQSGISARPYGLLYELVPMTKPHESEAQYLKQVLPIMEKYHLDSFRSNPIAIRSSFAMADIKQMYALSYINLAQYLSLYYHDTRKAQQFYQLATLLDPTILQYLQAHGRQGQYAL